MKRSKQHARPPVALLLVAAVALFATPAVAQSISTETTDVYMGAPAPGVDTPNRIRNPSESRERLQVGQPPSQAQRQGAQRSGDAEAQGDGEGDGPRGIGIVQVSGSRTAEPVRASWIPGHQIYRGVIPRIHDSLPHIARFLERGQSAQRPNQLTWIGFQPFDSHTRVFIQTARPERGELRQEDGGTTLVYRLENTRVSLSNFQRLVDARAFGRIVQTVRAVRVRGGHTDLYITLASPTSPEISAEGNYTYFDFPLRY